MCVLRLEAGAGSVLFTADVLLHPLQFARPRITSNFFDDPEMVSATREKLLSENAGTGTILAPAFGRVERAGDTFVLTPLPVVRDRGQPGT